LNDVGSCWMTFEWCWLKFYCQQSFEPTPFKRRDILATDANVSQFSRARNIRCESKFASWKQGNVSESSQKHFCFTAANLASETYVSQFGHSRKHVWKLCFRRLDKWWFALPARVRNTGLRNSTAFNINQRGDQTRSTLLKDVESRCSLPSRSTSYNKVLFSSVEWSWILLTEVLQI